MFFHFASSRTKKLSEYLLLLTEIKRSLSLSFALTKYSPFEEGNQYLILCLSQFFLCTLAKWDESYTRSTSKLQGTR
jgi:hypothetical protein